MLTVKKTEVESELASALNQALVALGRAGQAEAALRIAGRAFAAVRHDAPAAAQQINNVMHGLAKMPGTDIQSGDGGADAQDSPVPKSHN